MRDNYLPRIIDDALKLSLATSGAVLIVGPKWCGKTRTAEEIAASILYMVSVNSPPIVPLLEVF